MLARLHFGSDEVQAVRFAQGKTKEVVGRAINDRDLEAEGDADQAGGNVKEGFGKARRKVGEAVEDIGNAIGH